MKIVILAGGLGTRLGQITSKIPKPMVKIGNKPILWHLINFYSSHGFDDFIVALGYKSKIIKEFFFAKKIKIKNKTNQIKCESLKGKLINIKLVNTGSYTFTGGRLLRLKKFLKDDTFMLTYGDGLSNINISRLLKFHKKHKKIATVTGVRPIARFGELNIKGTKVKNFKEKPQINKGWINGGFFVFEPKIFKYLNNDKTILEGKPLEKLAKTGELMAYLHDGFWYCMDTPRDKDTLEEMWRKKNAPWKKW